MSKSEVYTIILKDGVPDGIRTACCKSSAYKAIAFRRAQLATVAMEISRYGVYILHGQEPDAQTNLAYIGEAADIADRLKKPAHQKKDYWVDTVVIFSDSKDDPLTKSDIEYAEAHLITASKSNTTWQQTNKQGIGDKPLKAATLPEAEAITMDKFIREAKVLVELLGCDIFNANSGHLVDRITVPNSGAVEGSPEFRFDGKGYNARAVISSINGNWIVKAGSSAKLEPSNSLAESIKKRRKQDQEAGMLKEEDGKLIFQEDGAFSSASTAASFISGFPTDGRNKAWKLENKKTYAEWENEQTA